MRAFAALLMMSWFLFGMVVAVGMVGKPRKTLTPDIAVFVVIIDLALIVATYWLWQS